MTSCEALGELGELPPDAAAWWVTRLEGIEA